MCTNIMSRTDIISVTVIKNDTDEESSSKLGVTVIDMICIPEKSSASIDP